MPGQSIALIKKIPIFRDFWDAECHDLLALLKRREFSKNETICSHEDHGDALFLLIRGRVKVALYSEKGKEIILSILKNGEFFGEMSLLDGEPRSASVIALEQSDLYILERRAFVEYVTNRPEMSLKILKIMSQRLRIADEKIGNLALLDVYGRIARFLLKLAETDGVECEDGVLIKGAPTHQEIAGLVGTSRETVSRTIADFKKKRMISVTGKDITIGHYAFERIIEKYTD